MVLNIIMRLLLLICVNAFAPKLQIRSYRPLKTKIYTRTAIDYPDNEDDDNRRLWSAFEALTNLTSDTSDESSLLPPHWEQLTDPETGDIYFHNTLTDESTWNPPANICDKDKSPKKIVYKYRGIPPKLFETFSDEEAEMLEKIDRINYSEQWVATMGNDWWNYPFYYEEQLEKDLRTNYNNLTIDDKITIGLSKEMLQMGVFFG